MPGGSCRERQLESHSSYRSFALFWMLPEDYCKKGTLGCQKWGRNKWGLRGICPPFPEIGQHRPYSPDVCLLEGGGGKTKLLLRTPGAPTEPGTPNPKSAF